MHKGSIAREGDPHTVFSDEPLLQTTGLCKPLALEVFEAVRQKAGLAPDAAPPRNKQALLAMLNKKL